MLEKINLGKKITGKEYKSLMEDLSGKLSYLQRECKEQKIPIMIVFEGWGASGKGTLINELIGPLDPRGFKMYTIQKPSEEEVLRPFLWRFWTKTPAKGRIHIFDRSWYRRVVADRFEGSMKPEELQYSFEEIVNFEKQLTDDGTVIIKFFLHISKEDQQKRLKRLLDSKETAWRVSKYDLKQNKRYDEYLKINDEMLEKTDTSYAPWHIIEAANREYASVKIISTVIEYLSDILDKHGRQAKSETDSKKETMVYEIDSRLKTSALKDINLDKTLDKKEYKKKLNELQERIRKLHSAMYLERIPVVLAFEGWDAGGKGGAIKRLTQRLDPRGYEVIPTASPNDIEKAHHYLWRFWNNIPKGGHLAIFDRTWYGRVMVERIEGFCSDAEWQRAYNEINQMEEHLTNFGCIVLKFWMHIDKDEQERRFLQRQEIPEKNWKITDEDWRNRAKWDEYEEAVDEMIIRTSTTYAPWIIVEANSKYYARIKVLETVVQALEERFQMLGKNKKKKK